ncbi:MAG: hypothetical protein IJT15_04225 [Rickettsiales bacterium]|nr:hypothetical protein [Rickettsiales bacterium]
MLENHGMIDDCVNSSITKYQTLKQKLQPEKKYEQLKDKYDISNKINNAQPRYNCWCIGDNNYFGCKKNGKGCGCFGVNIT